jgi:ParB-like chromosome segregation protein Spo0J
MAEEVKTEEKKSKYKKPRFEYLDISKIVVPSIRVTSEMPDELQEQFKSTIQQYGVVNPIKVAYDNGQYILIDGLHRLQELKLKGEEKVPAVVVEMPLGQALLENLISGKLQGRGKVTDMIKVIKYLHNEEKMSIEEIAAKTGYKVKYLYDLLSVANANPDLLQALDEEKIGIGHAIELARIPEDTVLLKALYTVIYRRMTVKDTKEYVDTILEALAAKKHGKEAVEKPKTPRDMIPVQCWVCTEEAPAKDMQTFVLCPKCQSVLFEWKAQYRAEMQKMLREQQTKTTTQVETQTSEKAE